MPNDQTIPVIFDPALTANMSPDELRNLQIQHLIRAQIETTRQISGLTEAVKEINDSLQGGRDRMDRIEKLIAENTTITKSVRETVTAGKVATKVIQWLAGFATAVTVIYAAYYQVTGHPPTTPPGQP